jgi:hypothetical protein
LVGELWPLPVQQALRELVLLARSQSLTSVQLASAVWLRRM